MTGLRAVLVALAASALTATGFVLWYCDDGPACPTEDSCTVDYRDGEWRIVEVEP